MANKPIWEKEADLCRDFTEWATAAGWVVYAETGGWDLLVVRPADGFQIGIEAKLSLNVKVLCQVLDSEEDYSGGPDIHAVLVPEEKAQNGLAAIARRLNIVVIQGRTRQQNRRVNGVTEYRNVPDFTPKLPAVDAWEYYIKQWPERCPEKRLTLPEYIPDVTGGHSAPVQLTDWKVKAIKVMIIIDRLGAVTRHDLKALKIDASRWCNNWLKTDKNGGWVPNHDLPRHLAIPDFKAQHPVNYEQIAADYEKWSKDLPARLA